MGHGIMIDRTGLAEPSRLTASLASHYQCIKKFVIYPDTSHGITADQTYFHFCQEYVGTVGVIQGWLELIEDFPEETAQNIDTIKKIIPRMRDSYLPLIRRLIVDVSIEPAHVLKESAQDQQAVVTETLGTMVRETEALIAACEKLQVPSRTNVAGPVR